MTLELKILEFKITIFQRISNLFETIATKLFGYPDNPGMLLYDPDPQKLSLIGYVKRLPYHITQFPPLGAPKTLTQAIFGNFPKSDVIERNFFEHSTDGYYNFYIENYRNIFFLPDWLSEWIQIHLDMPIDITWMETMREGLFISLMAFFIMMQLRLNLYWLLTINPYTRPWVYFISLTDWIYDVVGGFAPVVFGLDLTGSIVLGLTGTCADTLNHLVFTMPFLPSEGQAGKLMIDGKLKDVILFRYLPSLWYTNPIPNHLREYWYTERPEIYEFMEKNYGQLNINFLPDRLLENISDPQFLSENFSMINNISTNFLSEVLHYSFSMGDYF